MPFPRLLQALLLLNLIACAPALRTGADKIAVLETAQSTATSLGVLRASHGKGCGLVGFRGNYNGALAALKNMALDVQADYVVITKETKPYGDGECFHNEYVLEATAYRHAASVPLAGSQEDPKSPARSVAAAPPVAPQPTPRSIQLSMGLDAPTPTSGGAVYNVPRPMIQPAAWQPELRPEQIASLFERMVRSRLGTAAAQAQFSHEANQYFYEFVAVSTQAEPWKLVMRLEHDSPIQPSIGRAPRGGDGHTRFKIGEFAALVPEKPATPLPDGTEGIRLLVDVSSFTMLFVNHQNREKAEVLLRQLEIRNVKDLVTYAYVPRGSSPWTEGDSRQARRAPPPVSATVPGGQGAEAGVTPTATTPGRALVDAPVAQGSLPKAEGVCRFEGGHQDGFGNSSTAVMDHAFDAQGALLYVKSHGGESCDLGGVDAAGCARQKGAPIQRFDYAGGRLTLADQGKGGSTRYLYRVDGRLEEVVQTRSNSPEVTTRYEYPSKTSVKVTTRRNPAGRAEPPSPAEQLLDVLDRPAHTTMGDLLKADYTYDAEGRLLEVRATTPKSAMDKGKYIQIPQARVIRYAWDASGRLLSEADCAGDFCSWIDFKYRADGSLESVSKASGTEGDRYPDWRATFSEGCVLSVGAPPLPGMPVMPNDITSMRLAWMRASIRFSARPGARPVEKAAAGAKRRGN